jgi:hypothetical protein
MASASTSARPSTSGSRLDDPELVVVTLAATGAIVAVRGASGGRGTHVVETTTAFFFAFGFT